MWVKIVLWFAGYAVFMIGIMAMLRMAVDVDNPEEKPMQKGKEWQQG